MHCVGDAMGMLKGLHCHEGGLAVSAAALTALVRIHANPEGPSWDIAEISGVEVA
jgi:hypothetical protein